MSTIAITPPPSALPIEDPRSLPGLPRGANPNPAPPPSARSRIAGARHAATLVHEGPGAPGDEANPRRRAADERGRPSPRATPVDAAALPPPAYRRLRGGHGRLR